MRSSGTHFAKNESLPDWAGTSPASRILTDPSTETIRSPAGACCRASAVRIVPSGVLPEQTQIYLDLHRPRPADKPIEDIGPHHREPTTRWLPCCFQNR